MEKWGWIPLEAFIALLIVATLSGTMGGTFLLWVSSHETLGW